MVKLEIRLSFVIAMNNLSLPSLSFLCHMSQQTFSYEQLFDFTKSILQKIGCSEEHAATSAKVLLSADLRGIDSHGVARLSGYVRLWEVKRINTDPVLKIIHETPSTAVVDGDSGLGLVVAPFSMQ